MNILSIAFKQANQRTDLKTVQLGSYSLGLPVSSVRVEPLCSVVLLNSCQSQEVKKTCLYAGKSHR